MINIWMLTVTCRFPYIKREDNEDDWNRYQTVYAEETGSTAAPTAGLHFTELIIDQLKDRGIIIAPVTLHVGLGTFIPVRTENVEDHSMHEEEYEISEESAELINRAKRDGKRFLRWEQLQQEPLNPHGQEPE